MSRIKQFALCLLFFFLMRRPEPSVVSQPRENPRDSVRNVSINSNAVQGALLRSGNE